jgi:hypothetical protein
MPMGTALSSAAIDGEKLGECYPRFRSRWMRRLTPQQHQCECSREDTAVAHARQIVGDDDGHGYIGGESDWTSGGFLARRVEKPNGYSHRRNTQDCRKGHDR